MNMDRDSVEKMTCFKGQEKQVSFSII